MSTNLRNLRALKFEPFATLDTLGRAPKRARPPKRGAERRAAKETTFVFHAAAADSDHETPKRGSRARPPPPKYKLPLV